MVYVCSLNFFRYFEYVVLQKKKKICKIMHKEATLIIIHYITHLSFHLLRNHRTLQHINYSFLYLKALVKPELSIHVPMGHQNISFVSCLNPNLKVFFKPYNFSNGV